MANETPTCTWTGTSGKKYVHYVHLIGTSLKAEAGNYIFAKVVNGYWSPVYIGQTANLAERFDDHHKAQCIKSNGATHIHAHLNAMERERLAEEADLLASHKTSCNG